MISINLFVPDCKKAFVFYKYVFQAELIRSEFEAPPEECYAIFKIGGNNFAMVNENPGMGSKSPQSLGSAPMCLQIPVDDLEKTIQRAIEFGAKYCAPSTEEKPFFGSPNGVRVCNIYDVAGFVWSVTES